MACTSVSPPDGVLFQEYLRHDPFWMVVACQLVNLTSWQVAREAFREIRDRHPTPEALASADPSSLEDVLRPLGLWRRRSVQLPRFASAWLQWRPNTARELLDLPGVGKYAADSLAIFIEGRTDVVPSDGKLNWYMEQTDGNRLRREVRVPAQPHVGEQGVELQRPGDPLPVPEAA